MMAIELRVSICVHMQWAPFWQWAILSSTKDRCIENWLIEPIHDSLSYFQLAYISRTLSDPLSYGSQFPQLLTISYSAADDTASCKWIEESPPNDLIVN